MAGRAKELTRPAIQPHDLSRPAWGLDEGVLITPRRFGANSERLNETTGVVQTGAGGTRAVADVRSKENCGAEVSVTSSALLPTDEGQLKAGLLVAQVLHGHHFPDPQRISSLVHALQLTHTDACKASVAGKTGIASTATGKVGVFTN